MKTPTAKIHATFVTASKEYVIMLSPSVSNTGIAKANPRSKPVMQIFAALLLLFRSPFVIVLNKTPNANTDDTTDMNVFFISCCCFDALSRSDAGVCDIKSVSKINMAMTQRLTIHIILLFISFPSFHSLDNTSIEILGQAAAPRRRE